MFLPTDNSTLQLSIVDWSVKLLLSPLFLTYILSSIGVNELLRASFFLCPELDYQIKMNCNFLGLFVSLFKRLCVRDGKDSIRFETGKSFFEKR
jgi:hypothetical protein